MTRRVERKKNMFPPEVFTIVKTYLSLTDISSLVLTCKAINDWVDMNSTIREYYLLSPIHDTERGYLFLSACKNGYLNLVMYLYSIGCDPRVDNDIAIRIASEEGHLEVVKYLYSIGCDPRKGNEYAILCASKGVISRS